MTDFESAAATVRLALGPGDDVVDLLFASSTRPHDAIDLRALVGVAEVGDLELARQAVGLIEDRGYQRGRDLVSALDDLVRSR